MEDFNIIYDPNTMKKHSLYSNYGRSLLKQMLSSYKSGGTASFAQSTPTPPEPTGPPTLTRSLAISEVTTPTTSLPGQPLEIMSEAQSSQESRPRRNRSMRPEPILSGSGYSLDPSLPRIGGLGEIVEVDTCTDNQDGGYGDEDYREPEDQRPDKEKQGYDSTFPAVDDKHRNINEFNEAMRDYNTFKVQEQSGKGYSLDPSLPRIGGLGEIVEVDTCPDNQDGGDYFLDPSRPAIAGRTEVVGYKPCNHEPPTPVVADATNEVPQELQDGGMNLVRGAVDGIKKIGSNVVGTLKNVVERISGSESEDEDMDEYWGEEMVDMEIPTAKVEDDPAILRELAQLEADGMKILTADNL